ncbi:GvpL/GvpF family gas vesicle protein [Pantanalinema sp. GBBB05]|uniref:GvpL/GvpF family gas vesicle protein n=1 Tax=Pantanalinema sp. GBBB05 TaxID=2604139 RepID=UPI001D3EB4CE|nr:gas vesicle protein [Pantanalinema sp. GBBB05]
MYLYALLPLPHADLHLPEGIGTQVQLLTVGEIAAIVEPDVALNDLEQDDRQLLRAIMAHDRVIRELFAQITVLPFRFGTCFESSASLVAHLTVAQATYVAALQQLDGKGELTLKLTRVEPPEMEVSPDLKGKDYFLAKKQQYQQQQSFQAQQTQEREQIIAAIGQLTLELSFQPNHTSTESLYLLIARTDVEAVQRSLVHWSQHYTLWTLSLSEILPPYHFIDQFLSPKSAETR